MPESDEPLALHDLSRRARNLFVPLRECRGAGFVYGLLDHQVHDANRAAELLWAFAHDEFVGRSDGVARLWVNPLDWQLHNEVIRERGACLGLSTRLRGWDGRLTRCWVSSFRLIVGAEPLLVCYARPVTASQGDVIDPDDLARLGSLLDTPAAQPLRQSLISDVLVNASPERISVAR